MLPIRASEAPRVPEKNSPQPKYRGVDRGGHTKATVRLVDRHVFVSGGFPTYLPTSNLPTTATTIAIYARVNVTLTWIPQVCVFQLIML